MKRWLCLMLAAAWIGAAAPFLASAEEIGPGVGLPADAGTFTRKPEIGPGVTPQESGEGQETPAPSGILDNDFLDAAYPDPVVRPAASYTYENMAADIQKLKERYGDRMQVQVIGTSLDGREIYDLIVGNPAAPVQVLIQGGIHAREHMTPLLMMKQLETALVYYDTGHYGGRALSDLFQKAALHFVPMTNPDGVTLAQSGLAGIRSGTLQEAVRAAYETDKAEGRTGQPLEAYLKVWKSNAAGVDLNHNFPAAWEAVVTSAQGPSSSAYKGTAPLSEPESQALAALGNAYPWTATISYHSMGNILYWDVEGNRVREASQALALQISQVTGYPLNGSLGKGGFKDWMQSRQENPVPGVTIEVGSVACPLPLEEFDAVWQQNRAVWAQVLLYLTEGN